MITYVYIIVRIIINNFHQHGVRFQHTKHINYYFANYFNVLLTNYPFGSIVKTNYMHKEIILISNRIVEVFNKTVVNNNMNICIIPG